MPGLQQFAFQEFTPTANNATLPIVLADLPVAGSTRRFSAKALNQSVGSSVPSWADIAGSGTALVPVASTAPTLSTVGGVRSVVFNGSSDGLQQSVAMAQGHSLVLVSNILTVNSAITTLSGALLTSGTDSALLQTSTTALYANGGTALTIANQNVAGWRVIIVTFNGASSVVNINGTEYAGNVGALPRAVFSLGFQRGGTFSNLAVAEAVLYPTALDATQRAALVAQLRADHGI